MGQLQEVWLQWVSKAQWKLAQGEHESEQDMRKRVLYRGLEHTIAESVHQTQRRPDWTTEEYLEEEFLSGQLREEHFQRRGQCNLLAGEWKR